MIPQQFLNALDRLLQLQDTVEYVQALRLFSDLSQSVAQVPKPFRNDHSGIPWDQLSILDRALILGSCESHYGVQSRLSAPNDQQVKQTFMHLILNEDLYEISERLKIIDSLPGVFYQKTNIANNVRLVGDYHNDESSLNLLDGVCRALSVTDGKAKLDILNKIAPESKSLAEPCVAASVVARHLITVGECFTQLKKSNFMLSKLKTELEESLGKSCDSLIKMCKEFRNKAGHIERDVNESIVETILQGGSLQTFLDFISSEIEDILPLDEYSWRKRFQFVSEAARTILKTTFGYEYSSNIISVDTSTKEPYGVFNTTASFIRTTTYTGWMIPNDNPSKFIKHNLDQNLPMNMSYCYCVSVAEYSKSSQGMEQNTISVKTRNIEAFTATANKYVQQPDRYQGIPVSIARRDTKGYRSALLGGIQGIPVSIARRLLTTCTWISEEETIKN